MTGLRELPGYVLDALRELGEVPELRGPLSFRANRALVTDILIKLIGASRASMTTEEFTAAAMKAGFHVTKQQVTVRPMRAPGAAPTTGRPQDALTSVSEDSQRGRLLQSYGVFIGTGCTDEEAAKAAGIPESSCWWKRCGELRASGLIQPMTDSHGDVLMREGTAGVMRTVCEITPEGEAALSEFSR